MERNLWTKAERPKKTTALARGKLKPGEAAQIRPGDLGLDLGAEIIEIELKKTDKKGGK